MKETNPKIDAFLESAKKWREEMEKLRWIALDCGLVEELKWGKPCYTFKRSNVAIIQGFKEQCAFMFFKGALLKDPEPLPDELKEMFGEVSGLKKAFTALTPGRQRAYILHFSGAKQSKTRRSRIEKCVPRILDGRGLSD